MWIDFEGIDGSGKTTLSVQAARWLRRSGFRVTHARENGSFRSRAAARIRELTRDPELMLLAPQTEFLLNAAREAQVLAEEIRPALQRDEIVITDRALHSHVAMAHVVRGLPHGEVQAVADVAAGGRWPDVVIFVDVEPDVALLRKRMRKIRQRRLGSSGRKGLLGRSYAVLSRRAFQDLARTDSRRWHVLDNSFRSLEEAEEALQAILGPILRIPSPPPPVAPAPQRVSPAESLAEWSDRFYDFAEGLAAREPALAAIHVAGLDDPRADAIRRAALERDPDVAAWSVSGLRSAAAWAIRKDAAEKAPYHVARSLKAIDEPAAWTWRRRLEGEAPEQVLHSLCGLGGPQAIEMRTRLWDAAPAEALRSLAGLKDGPAWGLRVRGLRRHLAEGLAESLTGIDQPMAWNLREDLRETAPLSVLRSLRKLGGDAAWRFREEMGPAAPRVVLETMAGMDGAAAERLRDLYQDTCPEEVASSISGLDTAEAWRRRDELRDAAPGGVLESLYGLAGNPAAIRYAEDVLSRSEGQPRLARKATILNLKRTRLAALAGLPLRRS